MPDPGLIYKACMHPSDEESSIKGQLPIKLETRLYPYEAEIYRKKDNGHIKLEKPSNRNNRMISNKTNTA